MGICSISPIASNSLSPPYYLNVLSLSRPSSLFFALLSILIESSDASVSISSTVRGALYKLLLCFLDIWRSPICLILRSFIIKITMEI